MKQLRVEHDRIFEGDNFQGTCVVYGAVARHVTPFVCDVSVESLQETDVKETRAYRQLARRARKPVPPLRPDAFHHELFVIFGPEASPSEAVKSLKMLIKNIERHGLLIGRKEDLGDFYIETIDGKIIP